MAALYALVEAVYFAYDLSGNRALMQDEWGATYWTYDLLGRPTSRKDPRATTVQYAYGARGERTELTVDGQGTVYYEYGPTGLMDVLLDGKTGLRTYYEYDPAGRVRYQHHPNATATYFVYDVAGRLQEKVTKKDADASVLVRFAYTRDAAGNPIAIERESGLGVFYYAYDALQRLAYEGQFVSAARQYENYYEYDPAGNRTLLRHGETDAENLTYYDYDEANELLSLHDVDGWTYFAYDENGNTVMEQAPSWTRYYDWDGRDMMVGVRSTEQGWTENEIRYDGLASRASLFDSTGMTYFAWDGIRVLKLEDGDGDLVQRQVHGYGPIPSVGDIAQMESGGSQYVPAADQVGTVWKVVSSAGSAANSYRYDAFGVGRSVSETFSNPFRFQGAPFSLDAGLYWAARSAYDPTLGRLRSDGGRGQVVTSLETMSTAGARESPPPSYIGPAPKDPPWIPREPGEPVAYFVRIQPKFDIGCFCGEIDLASASFDCVTCILSYNVGNPDADACASCAEELGIPFSECWTEVCCKVWEYEVCRLREGTCKQGWFAWRGMYDCSFRGWLNERQLKFEVTGRPYGCPTWYALQHKPEKENITCQEARRLIDQDPDRRQPGNCS